MSRPRETAKSWKKRLSLTMMLGGFGLVGFAVGRSVAQLEGLRMRFELLTAWDLLALPVLFLFVIAVHEAGHLFAGLRQGMRFLLYVVGPFGFVRGGDGVRFRWFFNLGTLGGLAATLPDPRRPLAVQMQPVVLGGPLASLLLAALGFAIMALADGRLSAYGLIAGLMSTLIFLVTAAPFRAGGFMSDGMQWLAYRRGGADVQRRARLTALMGMSMAGVRPRELDSDTLRLAQAEADGSDVLLDMVVWQYSYAHALDDGNGEAAGAWIDRMAGALDGYPDGFRQGIALELAIFEALQRGRTEEAGLWLSRARGGIVDASRRHLAQAALAAQEGRREQARRSLVLAEKNLARGMDAGFARMGEDQIGEVHRLLSGGSQAQQPPA